jgi:hypothetical protein
MPPNTIRAPVPHIVDQQQRLNEILEMKNFDVKPLDVRTPIEQINLNRIRRLTAGRIKKNLESFARREKETGEIIEQDIPVCSSLFATSPVQVFSVQIPPPPPVPRIFRPPTPFPNGSVPHSDCEQLSDDASGMNIDSPVKRETPALEDSPPQYDDAARAPIVEVRSPIGGEESFRTPLDVNAMDHAVLDGNPPSSAQPPSSTGVSSFRPLSTHVR